MTDTQTTVYTIIANVLGIEPSEISYTSDFLLDFNATPKDIEDIKTSIETALEVILPDFDEDTPLTVASLMELVEDSLL